MSQSEKATSSCYLVNYRLLRPDYEDRNQVSKKTEVVDNQKITKNSYIFNIGCMSHPKKTASSCFWQTIVFECRLWKQKLFKIQKHLKKICNLHHRMYESSRKSYIIMLSRKLSTIDTWLWGQKLLIIKK